MRRFDSFFSSVAEKIKSLFNIKSEMSILTAYRIISLTLTSAFYLFNNPRIPLLYKAGVVVSLLVSSVIVLGMYENYHKSRHSIPWTVVLVETIGISILLIPTGGLSSPFMWYALNPVLVSACFLTTLFSWSNLLFYCCSALVISFYMFNPFGSSPGAIVSSHSYVFLVFALITYAVQLLAQLLRKSRADADIIQQRKQELELINDKLIKSNKTVNETMEQIMSLYQCVGALTSQSDKKALLQTFVNYAVSLSKAEFSFFYPLTEGLYQGGMITSGYVDEAAKREIIREINSLKENIVQSSSARVIECCDFYMVIAAVRTSSGHCGIIGTLFKEDLGIELNAISVSQLDFLVQLCIVIMERFDLEDVQSHLLIAQEQNRIANEMHDSVSQRLFSIVCAMHTMLARWDMLGKDEIKAQLDLVGHSASSASQELRRCIYQLSLKKRRQGFFTEIANYLNDLAKLNDLDIKSDFKGKDDGLAPDTKNVLNRMIREAVGNAIRHGKCKSIDLSLSVSDDAVQIEISDDGEGLAFESLGENEGLGLYNMRSIAHELNGTFTINSSIGAGTQVQLVLPIQKERSLVSGEA